MHLLGTIVSLQMRRASTKIKTLPHRRDDQAAQVSTPTTRRPQGD